MTLMASYRVTGTFTAFQRDYRRGEVLTDVDLACWESDEDRDIALGGLVSQGKIEVVDAADPAGRLQQVWGGLGRVKTKASDER
jgi:hypothetical protein